MKNILFLIFGLIGLFAVGSAFDSHNAQGAAQSEDDYAVVGGNVQYNFRLDTITNTELDTIPLGKPNSNNIVASPVNFMSLYTYDIAVLRTSISGTHNVKVYLDRSLTTTTGTATDWFTIDSTSATTATPAIMRSTDATGAKYRLRIKGTGTQSSSYKIWTLWKKKN